MQAFPIPVKPLDAKTRDSARDKSTDWATVSVTTDPPAPPRPAVLLLVGLAESQSTLAPSRTRPTHTPPKIAFADRLSQSSTLTRTVGMEQAGTLPRYQETRPSKTTRSNHWCRQTEPDRQSRGPVGCLMEGRGASG